MAGANTNSNPLRNVPEGWTFIDKWLIISVYTMARRCHPPK
jgi:hypothetical protein